MVSLAQWEGWAKIEDNWMHEHEVQVIDPNLLFSYQQTGEFFFPNQGEMMGMKNKPPNLLSKVPTKIDAALIIM